jgi:hypothetical protein
MNVKLNFVNTLNAHRSYRRLWVTRRPKNFTLPSRCFKSKMKEKQTCLLVVGVYKKTFNGFRDFLNWSSLSSNFRTFHNSFSFAAKLFPPSTFFCRNELLIVAFYYHDTNNGKAINFIVLTTQQLFLTNIAKTERKSLCVICSFHLG